MEYGLKRLESFPLSKRFIRELHKILMQGVRGKNKTPGEFRRTQNYIGSPNSTRGIRNAGFVPPPVEDMDKALDKFEKYLHERGFHPPLVELALIHYHFESIHPFLDGNGRIGRLLITLLLVQWKILPIPLLYLSAFFNKYKEEYCQRLMNVSTRGLWKEWLIFFLKGVTEQSRDAVWRSNAIQDLQEQWRKLCRQKYQSSLILDILDHFFLNPFWAIPDLVKELKKTYRGVQINIDKLIESGFLSEVKYTDYRKMYVATQILDIISRDPLTKR